MLTPAQERALAAPGHLCVTANAGSGKTRVLVERYLHLLNSGRASPAGIVAITFTDRASGELRRKIAEGVADRIRTSAKEEEKRRFERVREQLSSAVIGTIHSFCARILREYPVEADVDAAFTVLDRLEERFLREEAAREGFRIVLGDDSHPLRSALLDLLRAEGKDRLFGDIQRLVAKRDLVERFTRPGGVYAGSDEDVLSRWEGILRSFLAEELRSPALQPLLADAVCAGEGPQAEEARAELGLFLRETDPVRKGERFLILARLILTKAGTPRQAFKRWTDGAAVRNLGKLLEAAAPAVSSLASALPMEGHRALVERSRTLLEFFRMVAELYDRHKAEAGQLDFEDLQRKVRDILGHADIRSRLAARYTHIMVDEFQDTNTLQLEILEPLTDGLRAGNLFVVGDPKQSIYGFRDADVTVFQGVRRRIREAAGPGADLLLEESFRPLRDVAAFVNLVFAPLMSGTSDLLHPEEVSYDPIRCAREGGGTGSVEIVLAPDPRQGEGPSAGDLIARRLLLLAAGGETGDPIPFGDMAILLRTRSALPGIEDGLIRHGIPHLVTGGVGYFQTQGIQDFCGYLRFLLDPEDDQALAGILRSPFFTVSDEELFELSLDREAKSLWMCLREGATATESLSRAERILEEHLRECPRLQMAEIIERVVRDTDYRAVAGGLARGDQDLANLRKLAALARRHDERGLSGLYDFVRRLQRLMEEEEQEGQEPVDADRDAVQVLTIHSAKGLEFPVVVVPSLDRRFRTEWDPPPDLEIGLGPGGRKEDTSAIGHLLHRRYRGRILAEEKRILYVACTRARDRLILCTREGAPAAGSWMEWVWEVLFPDGAAAPGEIVRNVRTGFLRHGDSGFAAGEEEHELRIRVFSRRDLSSPGLPPPPRPAPPLPEGVHVEPVAAPPLRAVYSSTMLRTYEECAARYRLRYVLGMPDPERVDHPATDEDPDTEQAPGGDAWGRAFHSVMERVDDPGTGGPPQEAVEVPEGESIEPAAGMGEVPAAVERVLGSSFWKWVSRGTDARTEFPILAEAGGILLTGTLDRLFRDPDGFWHVLDFKTERLSGGDIPLRAAVHSLQMETYSLLVHRLFGTPEVRHTILFVRHPGTPVTNLVRGTDWERITERVRGIVGRIESGDFAPPPNPCRFCPFPGGGCSSLR
ncbi:MAG: UvrD-helicase domain-containing protein [Bacteroidota bacterium]